MDYCPCLTMSRSKRPRPEPPSPVTEPSSLMKAAGLAAVPVAGVRHRRGASGLVGRLRRAVQRQRKRRRLGDRAVLVRAGRRRVRGHDQQRRGDAARRPGPTRRSPRCARTRAAPSGRGGQPDPLSLPRFESSAPQDGSVLTGPGHRAAGRDDRDRQGNRRGGHRLRALRNVPGAAASYRRWDLRWADARGRDLSAPGRVGFPCGRPGNLSPEGRRDPDLARRLQVPRPARPGDLRRQGQEPALAPDQLLPGPGQPARPHPDHGDHRGQRGVDRGRHRGRGAAAGVHLDQAVRAALQRQVPRRQVLPVAGRHRRRGVSRARRSCAAPSAPASATSARTPTPGRSGRPSTRCCASSRSAPAPPACSSAPRRPAGRACSATSASARRRASAGSAPRSTGRSSRTSCTFMAGRTDRYIRGLEEEMKEAAEGAGVREGGPAARRPPSAADRAWRRTRSCSATAPTPT